MVYFSQFFCMCSFSGLFIYPLQTFKDNANGVIALKTAQFRALSDVNTRVFTYYSICYLMLLVSSLSRCGEAYVYSTIYRILDVGLRELYLIAPV